ncbi:MAG: hypothetical protein AB7Q29_03965 [Vicinamibacterales bacterium]
MRKRVRVLLLAALVAAVVVPVGFALSLDASRRAASPREVLFVPASDVVSVPAPILASRTARLLPGVPDGAKLLVAGAALFGLAAAVRRGG